MQTHQLMKKQLALDEQLIEDQVEVVVLVFPAIRTRNGVVVASHTYT